MIIEVTAILLVIGLLYLAWSMQRTIAKAEALGFNYERSATRKVNRLIAETLLQYAECNSDRYESTGTTDYYYEVTLYELGLCRKTIAELQCPHKIANRCVEIVQALKA